MANFGKQIKSIVKVVDILDRWSDALDEKSRNLIFNRVYHEINFWLYCALDEKHGDILLRNIPKRYTVKLFRQAQEKARQAQEEMQQAITNRWYYFGQLSRKRKLWVIAKFLSKRLFVYKILRPFVAILKRVFE